MLPFRSAWIVIINKLKELQVEARLEVIKRYDISPEELDAALKNYKEGD